MMRVTRHENRFTSYPSPRFAPNFGISAFAWCVCFVVGATARAAEPAMSIETPMSPPAWALLERELLRANTAACREFFEKYFDDRGYLLCVERWGADDGPDDAIENCTGWPILHALGAPDVVLEMYKKAWEGHLQIGRAS